MDNAYGCFSTIIAFFVVVAAVWIAVTAAVVIAALAAIVAAGLGIAYILTADQRKAENSNPNPLRDRSG